MQVVVVDMSLVCWGRNMQINLIVDKLFRAGSDRTNTLVICNSNII